MWPLLLPVNETIDRLQFVPPSKAALHMPPPPLWGGVYGSWGMWGTSPLECHLLLPASWVAPAGWALDLADSGLSSGCLGTGLCSLAQLTSCPRRRGQWAGRAATGRAECESVQRAGCSRAPQAPVGGREKAGAHPSQAPWGLLRVIRLHWDGASWTAAGHTLRPVWGLRVRTEGHT